MKVKRQVLMVIGAAILLGTAVIAAQKITQVRRRMSRAYGQWHSITVNRDIASITMASKEMEPLRSLGDAIEIRFNPAPSRKGTEIAARLNKTGIDGKSPKELLSKMREALRNTQWLVETGEILSPDKQPTTRHTLTSMPVQFATRHARGGGRL